MVAMRSSETLTRQHGVTTHLRRRENFKSYDLLYSASVVVVVVGTMTKEDERAGCEVCLREMRN
jgi:hypothetical protein